jgi:hypothetical protein
MPRFAILRQAHSSPELFDPVKRQLYNMHLWDEGSDGDIHEWFALTQGPLAGENFDRAASFIVKALNGGRSLTVLVDELNPLRMNPLLANGWPTLVAMLVLAFPEVRWHALVLSGRPRDDQSELRRWETFQALHGVSALFDPRGTSLFDGYGLRQHVLDCIFHEEEKERNANRRSYRISGRVPGRQALATVLDEEEGYRWLLSYMAYRHGFRVCAIAFWREAMNLLGPGGLLVRSPHGDDQYQSQATSFMLSLEDWFLSYPDQNVPAMSDLRRRSLVLPALQLQAPPLRRFLTVGHQHQSGVMVNYRESVLAEVRDRELAATGHSLHRDQQISFKPASGLYTLWKELGLDRDWNTSGSHAWNDRMRGKHQGLGPGYFWPPDTNDSDGDQEFDEGHSSPGRLLHIAEHLIHRATALSREAHTATEALRGAVLATQALEMLGAKTPTVSVEALLLKHSFEVTAECQFPGVEYHFNLKERLADIRANIKVFGNWLNPKRQKDFMLNAEAQILAKLAVILEEHGEYEEAELCQCELRKLHREISVRYDFKTRPILAPFILPFRLYIEFVLRSTVNFLLSILVLVLAFWIAHYLDTRYVSQAISTSRSQHSSGASQPELPGPTSALTARGRVVPSGPLVLELKSEERLSKIKEAPAFIFLVTPADPLKPKADSDIDGPDDNFYDAFKSIISGEPVDRDRKSLWTRGISYTAALLGVLNLGILVSVLHSRMNRR